MLENIAIINRLSDLKLYINKNLYTLVKQEVCDSKGINIINILQNIRKNTIQLKIPVYKEKDVEEGGKNKYQINQQATKFKIKALQKKISKQLLILDFLMLEQFTHLYNRPLYFYFIFDFRGRLYYKSKISPQSTYLFRYIYDYGQKIIGDAGVATALPINYEF
jgi:DNA-directed RNA polymerase